MGEVTKITVPFEIALFCGLLCNVLKNTTPDEVSASKFSHEEKKIPKGKEHLVERKNLYKYSKRNFQNMVILSKL